MTAARYAQPVTLPLSTLFPVDALTPENFERFVGTLVAYLLPEAEVNIFGSRGHAQKGADVVAQFPDGRVWSFQCKRVHGFGPAKVEKAIKHHSIEAERKFLVLSAIASPAAIERVHAAPDWTLWGKVELTCKVRSLPIERQGRLVDNYFWGQRTSLLGCNEPGPWVTSEEYFAPFHGRGQIFTHDWPLVGRDQDLEGLVQALGDDFERFTLLLGPGGIGKTRMIKEAVEQFKCENCATMVRFLSASQEPDSASLADLGTASKLLIVDDAHDRAGIKLLVEYVIDERNRAKLLIASRPYAEQRIQDELAIYGIVTPHKLRLEGLAQEALRQIVIGVLDKFGGEISGAERILAVASHNPLVAAMAARVVAVEGMIPELFLNETRAMQVIQSHFTDVITGYLGAPSDQQLLRDVLGVLALIQPFQIDDRRVAELVEVAHPSVTSGDVGRALKLLIDGGVIYKRGGLYRLMPDLLGDFLIEEFCIGADGKLAEFAMTVANKAEGDRMRHILVNLGRTDWRLAAGDTSNSRRLEPIWQSLQAIDNMHDRRIAAVEAVADYQPTQALAFVQAQIEASRFFLEFGNILKRVAYSPEHRADALGLLWDLGQVDDSEASAHSNPWIRVLADIAQYDQDKPISLYEDVAAFAFSLLDRQDVWSNRYTPFDVLRPLLIGEGETTKWHGNTLSISRFYVDYDVVADLRTEIIDHIVKLLESENPRAAFSAASMINEAIHMPSGMAETVSDGLRAKYENEFIGTLARIDALVAKGTLAPTTIMGIIEALRWHAQYGEGPLHDQACDLFLRLPTDIDFRFHAAIAAGDKYTFVGQTSFESWREGRDWHSIFISELLAAYPERSSLCDALVKRLDAVEAAGISGFHHGALLVDRMIAVDPTIGEVIIDQSLIPMALMTDLLLPIPASRLM